MKVITLMLGLITFTAYVQRNEAFKIIFSILLLTSFNLLHAASVTQPKSVKMIFHATFDRPANHWINIPLNQGKTTNLKAHFQNPIDPDDMDPTIPQIICDFKVKLKEDQVNEIRILVSKIKVCIKPEEETNDFPVDGIEYVYYGGKTKFLAKQYDDSETRYACKGAKALYKYIEKLIVTYAPSNCPKQYRDELFSFRE